MLLCRFVVGVGQGDAVALQQVEVQVARFAEVLDEGFGRGLADAVLDKQLALEALGALVAAFRGAERGCSVPLCGAG